jgi:hypothetical protein
MKHFGLLFSQQHLRGKGELDVASRTVPPYNLGQNKSGD